MWPLVAAVFFTLSFSLLLYVWAERSAGKARKELIFEALLISVMGVGCVVFATT